MPLDRLPFVPPLEPMLAKATNGLPEGDGWLYEPKWATMSLSSPGT
jgi:ATP-dependent DNA ligase